MITQTALLKSLQLSSLSFYLQHAVLYCNACLPFTVPSAAPDNVDVKVMNGSVVKVTWKRVHKDKLHGHLGGYRVIPQKHTFAFRHSLKGMALTLLQTFASPQPAPSPFTQLAPCFCCTKNILYYFLHICMCMKSVLRSTLCVSFCYSDKLVASAQPCRFKEKPRGEKHTGVPRGPRPRHGNGNNTLLRVQSHRHDLQRAGQWPRQPSRQLQNPRGRQDCGGKKTA